MLKLKNKGVTEFKNYIKNKNVFIFGAGAVTENCVDNVYFEEKTVTAIVDNSEKLWGTRKHFLSQDIEIINVPTLVEQVKDKGVNNCLILIAPMTFAVEMIDQLDAIDDLNGLECYVHALMRNTREEISEYSFTEGKQIIPKIIHYIWVGGKALPDEFNENINTWKKYNPDYEIIRWDESNYDFSWNNYMKEAYENQAWGFVPDVARLDIIYKHGGIYLDVDVKCVRNFDVLLNDEAFFGMGSADRIAIGVGFGACVANNLIKELRDYYIDKHFKLPDGKFNRMACYYYQHPIYRKYGFKVKNEYQKINNIVVYPPEVMSAAGTGGMGNFFSDKTLSVHQGAGTWLKQKEKKNISDLKELVSARIEQNKTQ